MIYDLCIIGGGPAGYVAAERAGQAGMKVVLFDDKPLGGVCLNEGCIPSKTLLYAAKLFEQMKSAEKYGLTCGEVKFDFTKIMERKEKIIRKLNAGITASMKAHKVEVVKGRAKLKKRTAEGIQIEAGDQYYEGKNVLIAAGSEAAVPPVKGLDISMFLTNREILQLKELPKSLNVIGGGVVGIEFASFFNALGTKVRVIEMLDEILPGIDKEISQMLREELTRKGIEFHLQAKVTDVNNGTVIFESNGISKVMKADQVLVSTGRKLNVEGLGLENINIEYTAKGITIDHCCRTNVPHVFAAGDVTGKSLLAHSASRAGEVAVNTMLGKQDRMRYEAIPGVVYTNPEIAMAGLTEEMADRQNIKVKVFKKPLVYAGRFVVENEGKNGLIKIIAGEKYGEILGVHIIGNPASEMIFGAAMAIEMQMRVQDLKEIVFPHPTVSEIFKEALF